MGLDSKPIRLRLIRIELDTGETEILATSLTDMIKYPYEIFAELYHLRWPIEEDYNALKYRLQIENFSGKSIHSVYQDFHAKVFSKNLTAVIATTTREDIIQKSRELKYDHQIKLCSSMIEIEDERYHCFVFFPPCGKNMRINFENKKNIHPNHRICTTQ